MFQVEFEPSTNKFHILIRKIISHKVEYLLQMQAAFKCKFLEKNNYLLYFFIF
jgi:hypothetical protein